MSTPYPYPQAGGDPAPPSLAPAYTLFDSVSVGLATLLGTPVAGTILMAINFRRLGEGSQAAVAVAIGLVVTAFAGWFGNLVPHAFTTAIAIGLLLGTRSVAQALQGPDVARHVNQGGKRGSRWAAAGIGIAVLAVLGGGIFLFIYERQLASFGAKVPIGTKDAIYYSGSATEAEAKSVGEKLKETGYFTDRGANVFLSKDTGGTVIAFVVKDGSWNQPDMVTVFGDIGAQIAPLLGGVSIKVRMVNTERETKMEMTAGKVLIGTKDEVLYFGSATDADAKALGEALKTAGYLEDRGITVLLSKGGGTVISLVVKEGIWDKPESVTANENLIRRVASSVGGLPINLRLLNTSLENKKELTVQ